MPLQPIETRRLYRHIADQVAGLIARGEFPPGSRLPAERELAQLLGVSRPSVREGLIALEVEGLVDVRVGSGIYVRRARAGAAAADVFGDGPGPFELIRARRLIESEVAELAARSARDSDIAGIGEAVRLMKTDIHGGDVYETNDRQFHVRIAEATRNSVLVSVVSMLWDLRESPVYAGLMRHAVTDGVRARSIADHERIARALAARDPAAARLAMQKHIDRVAREYERDWPLVASELNGGANGRAAPKPARPAKRRRAGRS
ncbi:MAG: FadR family transcriptional regulator [Candidatus Odyssella sp.]|nr:FadR family transcriptional regulator [Candidatus Odyssella sp.]